MISGVETSEDDKVGEFEKEIWIPGEFKSVLKLAILWSALVNENQGQPYTNKILLITVSYRDLWTPIDLAVSRHSVRYLFSLAMEMKILPELVIDVE